MDVLNTRRHFQSQRGFPQVLLVIALFVLSAAAQSIEPGVASIRESDLRDQVTYLASKELKGRGDGAPELKIAADFIAETFRRNGVKPAGDNGTYFQNFQMFTARLGTATEFSTDRGPLKLGSDYVPHYLSAKGAAEGPMVFLGYGVSAPHLKFDELAGVNLRGKIAVVLDRNPHAEDFENSFNRIHPSDIAAISTKARDVAKAGAVALVVIQNPELLNYSLSNSASTFRADYPRKDAPMGDMTSSDNSRIPVVIVSESAGRNLVPSLRDLQHRIDQTSQPQVVDLGKRARINVDIQRVPFNTQNVVGLIEGSDPRLKSEFVVVGAHYDHDGEYEGDIWPGADDNASGTAGVMALAKAFGNGRKAPARSILLCAFAGEEKGEIGSEHYAEHPLVPLERTVAMLQMDMIGRNEEHGANRSLWLDRETSAQNDNAVNIIGTIFSPDLLKTMNAANTAPSLDLKFRYDDTPENLLRRSDQWAFLKKNVPSLFIHTGEHPDYHRPGDTADKINYPKMEKIVKLVYRAVELLANSPSRPAYRLP
jgi:hypothetical protein